MMVEGGEEAGDALLFGDVGGDGDANFGELVVIEAEAVVGEALGVAVEEADGFGKFEEVAGEERVDARQGFEHYVGGTDEAVVGSQAGNTLPHAHHVVGDVVLVGQQVFFWSEFGFHAATVFFAIHHAVVHGDGEGGKTRLAGFLALGEQLAKKTNFEFRSRLVGRQQQLLHESGFSDLCLQRNFARIGN